jgi:hypothetical protein
MDTLSGSGSYPVFYTYCGSSNFVAALPNYQKWVEHIAESPKWLYWLANRSQFNPNISGGLTTKDNVKTALGNSSLNQTKVIRLSPAGSNASWTNLLDAYDANKYFIVTGCKVPSTQTNAITWQFRHVSFGGSSSSYWNYVYSGSGKEIQPDDLAFTNKLFAAIDYSSSYRSGIRKYAGTNGTEEEITIRYMYLEKPTS